MLRLFIDQALVVGMVDNPIDPLDSTIHLGNTYPQDGDLSSG